MLGYEDGSREVYRAGPEGSGVVKVAGFRDGAQDWEMQLARGLHILSYVEWERGAPVPETAILYDYHAPAAELPVPRPGESWQTGTVVRDPEGLRVEAQVQAWDAPVTREVGGCSYETIPVTIGYDTEDGYFEGIAYLPELGFGFLDWHLEGGERVSLPVTEIGVAE